MPRYALAMEFDGQAFQGTQFQPRLRTVQGIVSEVASALDGAPTSVRLGSRLDSAVSAAFLPADVLLRRTWSARALGQAFASKLPHDVVVRRVALVAPDWNAKRDALERSYRYRVLLRGVRPVLDTRALWVRQLDHAERLHELAALLVGRHDLSGFACLRGDGTDHGDPVRHYSRASWSREPLGDDVLWHFHISASGFLYKQIRGLVGAMVAVAQGRATMDDFHASLRDGRTARRISNLAPGHGLLLAAVRYDPEPAWETL